MTGTPPPSGQLDGVPVAPADLFSSVFCPLVGNGFVVVCLPFYEVRRCQSGKLRTLRGRQGQAGDRGEGSGSLGLWARSGWTTVTRTRARARAPLRPAACPLAGDLLGPSHSSERKMQSGVNWRGAVAQGCLMQALGWGQAGWRVPSGRWWPCWAPGRVGIGAGLARAEGRLVEFGAGPPSGAEVGVTVWIWGLP